MRLPAPALRVRLPSLSSLQRNPVVFALLGYGVAWALVNPGITARFVLLVAAAAIARASWRHPVSALTVVVVGVPFQALVQGYLFKHGVSPSAVTAVGYWKELILGIVLLRAGRSRADQPEGTVGLVAFLLVIVVALYLIIPFGPELRIRYVSARVDVAFVAIFFAARWLPWTQAQRRRIERWLIVAVAFIAALGLWNYFGQAGWSRWVEGTGLRQYLAVLIDGEPPPAILRTAFGDREVVRVGSIFLSPIELGYTLLLALAVIISRAVRGLSGSFERAAGVVCGICLVLTFCRSATVLLVVLAAVLAAGVGRLTRGAGVIAAAVLLLVILIASVGDAGGQVASGFDTDDARTSVHIERLGDSVVRITTHPLGTGLGTAAAVSNRFKVEGRAESPENFYFQFATEVGLVGMVLFIGFVVSTWRMLWRRARRERDLDALAPAGALAVLALGAIVLDTFQLTAVTWPLFAMAGMALSHHRELTPADVLRPSAAV